jgi:hypothetical protein
MKKLLLSLLGAAAMATVSSSAFALVQGVPFPVTISRGPVGEPAGAMTFWWDLELIAGESCQYIAEWDNATPSEPLAGECFFDEAKVLGNFSCMENSTMNFPSILTLDNSAAGGPCYGFDYFQQFRQVWMIMLGEEGVTGTSVLGPLQGVVQFTGGAPIVYGIVV